MKCAGGATSERRRRPDPSSSAHANANRLVLLRPVAHSGPRRTARGWHLQLPRMSAEDRQRLRCTRQLFRSIRGLWHRHRICPRRGPGGEVQIQVLPDLRDHGLSHRRRSRWVRGRRCRSIRRPELSCAPRFCLRQPQALVGAVAAGNDEVRQGSRLGTILRRVDSREGVCARQIVLRSAGELLRAVLVRSLRIVAILQLDQLLEDDH